MEILATLDEVKISTECIRSLNLVTVILKAGTVHQLSLGVVYAKYVRYGIICCT
jgi:hypothetical protein